MGGLGLSLECSLLIIEQCNRCLEGTRPDSSTINTSLEEVWTWT